MTGTWGESQNLKRHQAGGEFWVFLQYPPGLDSTELESQKWGIGGRRRTCTERELQGSPLVPAQGAGRNVLMLTEIGRCLGRRVGVRVVVFTGQALGVGRDGFLSCPTPGQSHPQTAVGATEFTGTFLGTRASSLVGGDVTARQRAPLA